MFVIWGLTITLVQQHSSKYFDCFQTSLKRIIRNSRWSRTFCVQYSVFLLWSHKFPFVSLVPDFSSKVCECNKTHFSTWVNFKCLHVLLPGRNPFHHSYNVYFYLFAVKLSKCACVCRGDVEGVAVHWVLFINSQQYFIRLRTRSMWDIGFSRACLLHKAFDTQWGTNFLWNSCNSHSVLVCPSGREQLQS